MSTSRASSSTTPIPSAAPLVYFRNFNRMISPGDFVQAGDAVNLTPAGRKRFFLAYEKRMSDTITHPLFDYKVSYSPHGGLQVRDRRIPWTRVPTAPAWSFRPVRRLRRRAYRGVIVLPGGLGPEGRPS
jgi:hypothetical protein